MGGRSHGFEIKSDSASLDRLAGRIEQRGRVFDYITLVCGRKLFRRLSASHFHCVDVVNW